MAQEEGLPGITSVLNTNPGLYVNNFSSLQKPEIIGYYTVDSGCTYSRSLSGLKYVILPRNPNVRFDLNHGLEKAIRNVNSEHDAEILEFIPRWLMEQENGEWMQADFITFRGLLAMLMRTPYEKKEGWIICATKVNKTIFLFSKKTEQKKAAIEQRTEKDRKILSWGYKFEQYVTADKPCGCPCIAEPVNESNEFVVLLKSRLNEHSLIYGAEIDGIKSEEVVTNLQGVNIVELKVNRQFTTDNQWENFKRSKTLNWWAQSFLAGTRKILCGLRDDDGIVHQLECFEVAKLPELGVGIWDPRVCMNFCERFLSFVKNLLQEETSPHVVWKFEWKPGEDITSARFESPNDLCFLPDWFLAHATSTDMTANVGSRGASK